MLFLTDLYPVSKKYLNSNSFTTASVQALPFEPTRADQQEQHGCAQHAQHEVFHPTG
jgi:hypothetical protein